MPTRNDLRWFPKGQGKHVARLLPPELAVAIRGRSGAPSPASLSSADAAVFVVDGANPEKALARLPHAALWLDLSLKEFLIGALLDLNQIRNFNAAMNARVVFPLDELLQSRFGHS